MFFKTLIRFTKGVKLAKKKKSLLKIIPLGIWFGERDQEKESRTEVAYAKYFGIALSLLFKTTASLTLQTFTWSQNTLIYTTL